MNLLLGADFIIPGIMSELLDLYDVERRPLGITLERGREIPQGCYHLVAEIWTIGADGRLLMTKRDPSKPCGGLWECSGGAVVAGESSAEGAKRELREETGIEVGIDELIPCGSCYATNHPAIVDIFAVKVDNPTITLQEGETVDYRWATFDEVRELCGKGQVVPSFMRRFETAKSVLLTLLH